MFQLLSSFWLISLAGLLVPVLIHLWHKKPPKVIRVGSIRWLQAAASKRLNKFRFQDWPLLLLRCLLLSLLVFFLCQPVWQRTGQTQPTKQVFVSPDLLAFAQIKNIQSTLDNLIKQGYELRTFTPGFDLILPEKWQQIKLGKEHISVSDNQENYWSLASLIPSQFKKEGNKVIITSDRLANFKGTRPVLPSTYQWLTLPSSGKANWVQEGIKVGSDSLMLVLGNSTATGTQLKQIVIPLPVPGSSLNISGLPGLRYQSAGEKEFLFSGDNPEKINIQQAPLRVSILYDATRQADAGYVQAALQAISSYTRRRLDINLTTNISTIVPESQWVFWLSDTALPEHFKKRITAGTLVLQDASTQAKTNKADWLRSNSLPDKIAIYQQQAAAKDFSLPTWQNNFGEAILHQERLGKGTIYYFQSRFNPDWNDLPLSPQFPELISLLLFPDQPLLGKDRRTISPQQAEPNFIKAKNRISPGQPEYIPLKEWFLALAALLFLAERIWSYRNATV